MNIGHLITFLENIAPLSYQEDYDNSGLIVGDPNRETSKALISLDCTEEVVEEAIQNKCDIIISHHPIVFRGLKKLNGKTYIERVVMKAIKHDIALYAIHTNFDNVLHGVNAKICAKLGLTQCRILSPKQNLLKKLVTFCPTSHADQVRETLFNAGAGHIGNYSECSFSAQGTGTFKGNESTNPFTGKKEQQHHEQEVRIETIYPTHTEHLLLKALKEVHPYEEVAFDLYPLANHSPEVGSGMIGILEKATEEETFLRYVKKQFNAKVIRHTAFRNKMIHRVAVCGGAGGFLLPQAIRAGADLFITADYKYHEFFDAEKKIIIADIGHFESEQFTQDLLQELITKKFPKFVTRLTVQNTNPINYLI